MAGKIIVVGPRDKRPLPKGDLSINVTSKSKDFGKNLSPFLLGPVPLYWGLTARKMENAWQFSKVYKEHTERVYERARLNCWTDNEYEPRDIVSSDWWEWALKGFLDNWGHRYPMGRGAKPLYSFWKGEKLDYIPARKRIYIPLYAWAATRAGAFYTIKEEYEEGKEIVIWDFDGYNYEADKMTLEEVLNEPKRIMGHGHVLAMMLEKPSLVRPLESQWD